jgi:hypothetical protein
MKNSEILIGVLISIVTMVLGSFLFIEAFTHYPFVNGIRFFKAHGLLGKIITLGAILNIILFFILLKFNKDAMAKGVLAGMILLTVVTLFV